MISDFKNKVVISRPGEPEQTPGGGLLAMPAVASMTKHAKIRNRSGSLQVDSSQREWNYDYEITVRYTPSFVEKSSDLISFEGKDLVIRSVSFDEEGGKRFVILRCSMNE